MPMSGIFTAFATWYTIRTATGKIAGPEKPPILLAITGCLLRISIRMPSSVLMRDSPSAPASSAALAMDAMSVTLGLSLIYTGLDVTFFTSRVTSATFWQLVPNAMPPPCTLGQETFTSRIPTSFTASMASASRTYSGMLKPETLAIKGLWKCFASSGISS